MELGKNPSRQAVAALETAIVSHVSDSSSFKKDSLTKNLINIASLTIVGGILGVTLGKFLIGILGYSSNIAVPIAGIVIGCAFASFNKIQNSRKAQSLKEGHISLIKKEGRIHELEIENKDLQRIIDEGNARYINDMEKYRKKYEDNIKELQDINRAETDKLMKQIQKYKEEKKLNEEEIRRLTLMVDNHEGTIQYLKSDSEKMALEFHQKIQEMKKKHSIKVGMLTDEKRRLSSKATARQSQLDTKGKK